MTGRIIKGIGGFYYVYTKDGIYTCKAKGAFRKDKKKPLVGDWVEISPINDEPYVASVQEIRERANELIRPNVSNVDQALIIFALKSPDPNFVTLDKMIIQYKKQDIPVIICFNKEDLVNEDYIENIKKDYAKSGCKIFVTSTYTDEGIAQLREVLIGRTTTVAGPSGAGKSSLVNKLSNGKVMEIGEISEKLSRGKHTTRHSEIIPIADDTYIIDTPGFSSFEIMDIEEAELSDYYEEFNEYSCCRFMPCSHTHEPGCGVKEAVESGDISRNRYDTYTYIYNELIKSRRY